MLSISLNACTSLKQENEIKAGNWFALGKYDASQGYIEKSKNKLKKMSDENLSSEINYGAYLAGYEEALLIYCEPQNAYILGVTGQPYHNICDRYPRGWAFYEDWINGRNSRAGSM